MPSYTIPELAQIWTLNGGDPATRVPMVAIALAESSGNSDAVSATDDYGLWQENGANFPSYGMTALNWQDVDQQARTAIAHSGNGVDFAPWSTAYADISASGFYSSLPQIEAGSPAAAYLPIVAATLSVTSLFSPTAPGTPVSVSAGGQGGDLVQSVTDLAGWMNDGKPAMLDQMVGLNDLILGAL